MSDLIVKQDEWSELLYVDALKVGKGLPPVNDSLFGIATKENKFQIAGAWVADSIHARHIDYPKTPEEVRWFLLGRSERLRLLYNAAIIIQLTATLLEQSHCGNRISKIGNDLIHRGAPTRLGVTILDLLCLLVYCYDLFLTFSVNANKKSCMRRPWSSLRLVICLLIFVDCIIFFAYPAQPRIFRCLLPFLLISRRSNLKLMVQGLITSGYHSLPIIKALACLLLLWGFVGYVMFRNVDTNNNLFANWGQGIATALHCFTSRPYNLKALNPIYAHAQSATVWFMTLQMAADILCIGLIVAVGAKHYKIFAADTLYRRLLDRRHSASAAFYAVVSASSETSPDKRQFSQQNNNSNLHIDGKEVPQQGEVVMSPITSTGATDTDTGSNEMDKEAAADGAEAIWKLEGEEEDIWIADMSHLRMSRSAWLHLCEHLQGKYALNPFTANFIFDFVVGSDPRQQHSLSESQQYTQEEKEQIEQEEQNEEGGEHTQDEGDGVETAAPAIATAANSSGVGGRGVSGGDTGISTGLRDDSTAAPQGEDDRVQADLHSIDEFLFFRCLALVAARISIQSDTVVNAGSGGSVGSSSSGAGAVGPDGHRGTNIELSDFRESTMSHSSAAIGAGAAAAAASGALRSSMHSQSGRSSFVVVNRQSDIMKVFSPLPHHDGGAAAAGGADGVRGSETGSLRDSEWTTNSLPLQRVNTQQRSWQQTVAQSYGEKGSGAAGGLVRTGSRPGQGQGGLEVYPSFFDVSMLGVDATLDDEYGRRSSMQILHVQERKVRIDSTDSTNDGALPPFMRANQAQDLDKEHFPLSARIKVCLDAISRFTQPLEKYCIIAVGAEVSLAIGSRVLHINLFESFHLLLHLMLLIQLSIISYDQRNLPAFNYGWFLLVCFWLFMLVKLRAIGYLRYFTFYENTFDAALNVSSLVTYIALSFEYLQPDYSFHVSSAFGWYLLVQCFRMLKVFFLVNDIKIFEHMMPVLARATLIFFSVVYFFSIFGYNYFCDALDYDDALDASDDSDAPSWAPYENILNFRTILQSFFTLFELSILGNWSIVMDAVVVSIPNDARAYIFFYTYRLFVTLLVLPILVSFIIQAFLSALSKREKEKKADALAQHAAAKAAAAAEADDMYGDERGAWDTGDGYNAGYDEGCDNGDDDDDDDGLAVPADRGSVLRSDGKVDVDDDDDDDEVATLHQKFRASMNSNRESFAGGGGGRTASRNAAANAAVNAAAGDSKASAAMLASARLNRPRPTSMRPSTGATSVYNRERNRSAASALDNFRDTVGRNGRSTLGSVGPRSTTASGHGLGQSQSRASKTSSMRVPSVRLKVDRLKGSHDRHQQATTISSASTTVSAASSAATNGLKFDTDSSRSGSLRPSESSSRAGAAGSDGDHGKGRSTSTADRVVSALSAAVRSVPVVSAPTMTVRYDANAPSMLSLWSIDGSDAWKKPSPVPAPSPASSPASAPAARSTSPVPTAPTSGRPISTALHKSASPKRATAASDGGATSTAAEIALQEKLDSALRALEMEREKNKRLEEKTDVAGAPMEAKST